MTTNKLVNKIFPNLFGVYVRQSEVTLGYKKNQALTTVTVSMKRYKKAIKKLHKSPIRLITNHSTCYPLDV